MFSRRLQGNFSNKKFCLFKQFFSFINFLVQERLTEQIANALEEAITPKGTAVVIEARYILKFSFFGEQNFFIVKGNFYLK